MTTPVTTVTTTADLALPFIGATVPADAQGVTSDAAAALHAAAAAFAHRLPSAAAVLAVARAHPDKRVELLIAVRIEQDEFVEHEPRFARYTLDASRLAQLAHLQALAVGFGPARLVVPCGAAVWHEQDRHQLITQRLVVEPDGYAHLYALPWKDDWKACAETFDVGKLSQCFAEAADGATLYVGSEHEEDWVREAVENEAEDRVARRACAL